MAFDFGSMLAGFAERDVELRDRAREDSLQLARDTLNYRAELGMSRRKEKQAELKSAVSNGRKLMDNYNFSMQQIGVLASQGKLDQVAELYDRAAVDPNFKGTLPDPNSVVSIMEEKPLDMPFEEYMRSLVIGDVDTSRSFERDIGADAEPKDSFFRLTGFDPYEDARTYQQEYEKSLGMGADEMSAYAFDAFTPARETGQVDISAFKPADSSKFRVDFKDATKSIGADLAQAMGLESNFQYGEFLGVKERGERALQHSKLTEAGASKVVDLMRDEGLDYDQALSRVKSQMFSSEGLSDLGVEVTSETSVGSTGGAAGLVTEEVASNITNAQSEAEIRDIVKEISAQPGGMEQANAMMRILRENRGLSLEELKQLILGVSSAAEPVTPSAEDSPANRFGSGATGGRSEAARADNIAANADIDPAQEVASARTRLMNRGVDVTDERAVKTALINETRDVIQQGFNEFPGEAEEYEQMISEEMSMLARAIVNPPLPGIA